MQYCANAVAVIKVACRQKATFAAQSDGHFTHLEPMSDAK